MNAMLANCWLVGCLATGAAPAPEADAPATRPTATSSAPTTGEAYRIWVLPEEPPKKPKPGVTTTMIAVMSLFTVVTAVVVALWMIYVVRFGRRVRVRRRYRPPEELEDLWSRKQDADDDGPDEEQGPD